MNDLTALRLLARRAPVGRDRRHPYEVGMSLPAGTARTAGFLHDVVEDGFVALAEVRAMFGDDVADTVDAVTRRDGETYADFVARAAAHPTGRMVKTADVRCNLSTLPDGHSLRRRYTRALAALGAS